MDCKYRFYHLILSFLLALIVYLPSTHVLAVAEKNDWLKQATATIKQHEKVQKRLTIENVKIETLTTSLKEISLIRSKSQECIAETESLLVKTIQDLKALGEITKKENPEVSKKRRDLIKENKNLDLKLATCNLLLIQSQDLTKSFNQLQQAIIAQQLSARTPDIISVIKETLQSPIASWDETISFIKNQYRQKLLTIKQISLLAALMFFSFLVGVFVRRKWLLQPISAQLPSDTLSAFMQSIRCTLINAIPVLLPMLVMLLFLIIALPLKPLPLITKTSFVIASYISLIVFINVLLHPTPPAQNYLIKTEHLSRKFSFQLKVLLTLALTNFFLSGDFKVGLSEQLYYSSRGVISVLLIINLVSILWLVRNFSWAILSRKPRIFLTLLLFVTLIVELAGYRNLSGYILGGLLGTLAAFAFTLLIYHLLKDLCDGLDEGRLNWELRFRKALGLKKNSMVPGLIWIRLIIFTVLCIYCYFTFNSNVVYSEIFFY